ncbi:Protein F01F1.2 [Aphelenchoides avenae]|nr:Protein F01F1.2 [Aphelenchus avenae]
MFFGGSSSGNDASAPKVKEKLSAVELQKLKEGEIIVGEDGKRYRVRKTMLPEQAASGPKGLGDPEDKTLRKMEADTLIPKMMNHEVEDKLCREQFMALADCLLREGQPYGLWRCRKPRDVYNDCKVAMFADPAFRQRKTEEYLAKRTKSRETGESEEIFPNPRNKKKDKQ